MHVVYVRGALAHNNKLHAPSCTIGTINTCNQKSSLACAPTHKLSPSLAMQACIVVVISISSSSSSSSSNNGGLYARTPVSRLLCTFIIMSTPRSPSDVGSDPVKQLSAAHVCAQVQHNMSVCDALRQSIPLGARQQINLSLDARAVVNFTSIVRCRNKKKSHPSKQQNT